MQKNFVFLIICSLIISACASIQGDLPGGAKDTIPPTVIRENPCNLAKHFHARKIEIEFDKFIKLQDELKEISISPSMEEGPEYHVRKKKLQVKLLDTLQENTTYQINFGHGIVDINEGNALKNYSYVFSTGPNIDSLYVSGKVVDVLSKKPQAMATVFVLPLSQDSLFGKKRANLFSKADTNGNFIISHLKADKYKIYAVSGKGDNRIYNSHDQEVAFLDTPFTLNKSLEHIKLETFKEKPSLFKIVDKKLWKDGHMSLVFNKPVKRPAINIIKPEELDKQKVYEFNHRKDTVQIWLPQIKYDSMLVVIKDGEDVLDTGVFYRSRRDTYFDEVKLSDNVNAGGIKNKFLLTCSAPILTYKQNKIKLFEDSIQVKNFDFQKDSLSSRKFCLQYPWGRSHTYRLNIEPGTFNSLQGGTNKLYEKTFSLLGNGPSGSLAFFIRLPELTGGYLLQLLRDENVFMQTVIDSTGKVEYHDIPTGKYKVRIIYDKNKNGEWDTGNVQKGIQPERVWNYPKEILLRANWEMEERFDIPADPDA